MPPTRFALLASTTLTLSTMAMGTAHAQEATSGLVPVETILKFDEERPGNPAVGPDRRIFVSMSALSGANINVREIVEGEARPFPDPQWAGKPEGMSIRGIAGTIGIKVARDGTVWSLDMGSSKTSPPQPPKLVAWSSDGKLKRVIIMPGPVLRPNSFLQDFALDEGRGRIYIADMTFDAVAGISDYPAFLVVDVDTGMVRRVLERHPSTMPSGEPIVIDGKPVAHAGPDGEAVPHQYGLNPVAISPDGEWVYYGPMGAKDLYRIPASALADAALTGPELAGRVKRYSDKPHTDGIAVDGRGNVYVTDVENYAVGVCSPSGCRTIARDRELLSWPDGLAIDPDGSVVVVANELQNLPGLNRGTDASSPPYYLNRIRLRQPGK